VSKESTWLIISYPYRQLKTLPLNLGLRRRNRSRRVRIHKVASRLSILELSRLGRANTHAAGIGTAARCAIRIVDTPARDKLSTTALPDVTSSRVVGCDLSHDGDGN